MPTKFLHHWHPGDHSEITLFCHASHIPVTSEGEGRRWKSCISHASHMPAKVGISVVLRSEVMHHSCHQKLCITHWPNFIDNQCTTSTVSHKYKPTRTECYNTYTYNHKSDEVNSHSSFKKTKTTTGRQGGSEFLAELRSELSSISNPEPKKLK